jgi:parvulin-like peptidyl-prolyl isomerase
VIERLKDPPAGPERIAAKHILISYAGAPKALEGAKRSEAEARALAEQVDAEARAAGTDWNALAARYTEEPGSKTTGGDLGHFGRGQMVPAFERAAFALKVGETSAVVQSPFGFHIIRRYE